MEESDLSLSVSFALTTNDRDEAAQIAAKIARAGSRLKGVSHSFDYEVTGSEDLVDAET